MTKREMRRRQFLGYMGGLAGAAALAACGATPAAGPADSSSQERVEAASEVTVQWWEYPMWEGVTGQETVGLSQDDPKRADYTPADWPNWAAEQFAQDNPGFKANVELLTWEEGRNKLTVAATTGAGRPHLFLEDGPVILKFARVGAMLPVELSGEDQEDFFPGALQAGSAEGKLWYRPWLAGSRFLLVNRAIFQERGIEDLIPTEGDRLWDYEQFLEAALATTFTRDSGEQVFAYTSHFAHSAAHFWVDSFLWGYGGSVFDESGETCVIDSPECEQGLQFVADMQSKYNVMPPGSAGLQGTDVNNMFYQGRLAMMIGSHGSSRAITMAKEDGTIPNPDAIEIYPIMFPSKLPDIRPSVYTVFMGYGQFDTGTDAEKAITAKFIDFITNKENAKAPLAANLLPCRQSSSDVFEGDDFMLYALKAMNFGHIDTLSPYYDACNQYLNPMWQAVLSGERTPKEALVEAQERCNDLIAELKSA